MVKKILLTSFQTWLPHQVSNASDDLLAKIQQEEFIWASLAYLRQLPVDVSLASQKAIATIQTLQLDAVICCGMAESRERLTVEAKATWDAEHLYTSVKLDRLIVQLSNTHISHDAGKFVCEGLYYRVLKYLQQVRTHRQCLFVHVPVLNDRNMAEILADFRLIVKEIGSL
jgi:pyroglutamyl-peptidase